MHSGKPWQGELSNRRQDGVDYTALLLAIPLRQPDGRISNYLQLHEDISEHKRLAAELDRHRHRLEEQVAARTTELAEARLPAEATNRANSAVLANMSHEIRTPMSAIIGLNQLLRRDAARPEQAQRLDKIAQASRHLLASINDILDLSKIEAGKVRLEHTPLNLSALFDKVASVIGEVARSKGLQVLIDIDGMPMRLPGDATRLRQALLDYAGKAVKFSDHGSVTLRARLLEGGPMAGCWCVSRWWTTRGHRRRPPAAPVQRLRAGRRQHHPPVRWHRPGPGHHAPAAAEADAPALLRQRHGGARVLLAEANEVNRELAHCWLHDLAMAVDTAMDGEQALACARAPPLRPGADGHADAQDGRLAGDPGDPHQRHAPASRCN